MIIKSKFDKSLVLDSAKRLSRRIASVGDITLVYALYELNIGSLLYAVAVSDGDDLTFRLFDRFAAAEELFLTAVENGLDPASLDAAADDMICNNIL